MQTFKREHAIQILKRYRGADKLFWIDERGVWPADEKKKKKDDAEVEEDGNWAAPESDQTETEESKFGQWRPVEVFANDPDAPDVDDTPMLPFPFTAGELAAFMVGGVGAAVAGHYGDWADGPDPDRLNDIPQRENFARLAVKGAFDAYREAEKIVGPQPLALYVAAEHARKAYNKANSEANIREGVSDSIPGTNDSSDRRARAVASIAELEKQYDRATKAYQKEQEKWMNLMVRELLKPAPAQTAPAPVVTASDVKQWLLPDPNDPPIVPPKDQPWYTPARYFARQLVISDSTLLIKKLVLADKVSKSLAGAGIFKRGGKKPHSPETVLKAFANVTLG